MTNITPQSGMHHRLPSSAILPLFDTLFGVALTLLAYSIPDHLMSGMDALKLGQTVSVYLLTGVSIILYWYKVRRLIHATRLLLPAQLALGASCLLLIVMMPKFAQLIIIEGGGSGDFLNWTPSQIANTAFILLLGLIDGICLGYTRSIIRHPYIRVKDKIGLRLRMRAQCIGFVAIVSMGALELATSAFNREYVMLLPLVLLAEEWWIGAQLGGNSGTH